MLAVFRDDGSSTACCSGLLFFGPRAAPSGLSTVAAEPSPPLPGLQDDDDGAPPGEPGGEGAGAAGGGADADVDDAAD